jgi:tetratricopeptide (TPR) repeat protein
LRDLAVFADGCSLEAAAAVAQTADEYEALARLTALHDKSLLLVERGAGAGKAVGRPRYRMLETVRQYALHKLRESGEPEAARARHAEYFLAMAEAAAPHLRGPEQSTWMARLRAEHENLVAAMNWCAQDPAPIDPTYGLRLAAATNTYWLFNDVELGCRLSLDALRSDGAAADGAARFQTLRGLAGMYMHRGRGEDGFPYAKEALAIAQRLGVAEWQAIALVGIGTCINRAGNEEAALSHYTQARDLAQASGAAVPLSTALNNIATIEFRRGNWEFAEQGFRQALHLARGRGDVRSALIFLHNLIRVQVAARKHEGAHACAVEAEAMLREVGEDVLKLELLEVSGGLASSRGEHEFAARFWGVATQRYIDAGYRRPPEDQTQLERLSAESRRALGDLDFDRAEAAGRALDIDTAIRELRQWLERYRKRDARFDAE